jgi:CysZ protein
MTNPQPIQQIVNAPVHFFAGATYPLLALLFLQRSPQLLLGGILIPIALNLGLGVALYASVLFPGWQWLGQLDLHLPSWLSWLDLVLQVLLAIVLFGATGFLLVQFGAILGSPWYGQLAETIEKLRVGELPSGQLSFTQMVQDIGRAIAFQLKKLGLTLAIGLPLLLLNLLPPIGTLVASIGGITLGVLLVSMDFLDPPLERRRLSFRTKLGLLVRTLPASASFSLVCFGLASIPFLNLLTIPLCTIAGTLFSCDYALPKLQQFSPE